MTFEEALNRGKMAIKSSSVTHSEHNTIFKKEEFVNQVHFEDIKEGFVVGGFVVEWEDLGEEMEEEE